MFFGIITRVFRNVRKDMGFEIERKFLVSDETAEKYLQMVSEGKLKSHEIEQAYLTTDPVIRVRRSDDEYYMTYKGKGL